VSNNTTIKQEEHSKLYYVVKVVLAILLVGVILSLLDVLIDMLARLALNLSGVRLFAGQRPPSGDNDSDAKRLVSYCQGGSRPDLPPPSQNLSMDETQSHEKGISSSGQKNQIETLNKKTLAPVARGSIPNITMPQYYRLRFLLQQLNNETLFTNINNQTTYHAYLYDVNGSIYHPSLTLGHYNATMPHPIAFYTETEVFDGVYSSPGIYRYGVTASNGGAESAPIPFYTHVIASTTGGVVPTFFNTLGGDNPDSFSVVAENRETGDFYTAGLTKNICGSGLDGQVVLLVRYTKAGVRKATLCIGGVGNEDTASVAVAPDGDVVCAMRSGSTSLGGTDIIICRFDSRLQILRWKKALDFSGGQDTASSVNSLRVDEQDRTHVLIRTNSVGNGSWNIAKFALTKEGGLDADPKQHIVFGGPSTNVAYDVRSTHDKSLLFAFGDTSTLNAVVVKIDTATSGITEAKEISLGSAYDFPGYVFETLDGNRVVIFASKNSLSGSWRIAVAEYDAKQGVVKWARVIDGVGSFDMGLAGCEVDGQYIITGHRNGGSGKKALLLSLSKQGDLQWIYEVEGTSRASSLVLTNDNAVLITGQMEEKRGFIAKFKVTPKGAVALSDGNQLKVVDLAQVTVSSLNATVTDWEPSEYYEVTPNIGDAPEITVIYNATDLLEKRSYASPLPDTLGFKLTPNSTRSYPSNVLSTVTLQDGSIPLNFTLSLATDLSGAQRGQANDWVDFNETSFYVNDTLVYNPINRTSLEFFMKAVSESGDEYYPKLLMPIENTAPYKPVIILTVDATTIPKNADNLTLGTVSCLSVDFDAQTVTCRITGDAANYFELDADYAIQQISGKKLDFVGNLSLTVVASDGEKDSEVASQTLTIVQPSTPTMTILSADFSCLGDTCSLKEGDADRVLAQFNSTASKIELTASNDYVEIVNNQLVTKMQTNFDGQPLLVFSFAVRSLDEANNNNPSALFSKTCQLINENEPPNAPVVSNPQALYKNAAKGDVLLSILKSDVDANSTLTTQISSDHADYFKAVASTPAVDNIVWAKDNDLTGNVTLTFAVSDGMFTSEEVVYSERFIQPTTPTITSLDEATFSDQGNNTWVVKEGDTKQLIARLTSINDAGNPLRYDTVQGGAHFEIDGDKLYRLPVEYDDLKISLDYNNSPIPVVLDLRSVDTIQDNPSDILRITANIQHVNKSPTNIRLSTQVLETGKNTTVEMQCDDPDTDTLCTYRFQNASNMNCQNNTDFVAYTSSFYPRLTLTPDAASTRAHVCLEVFDQYGAGVTFEYELDIVNLVKTANATGGKIFADQPFNRINLGLGNDTVTLFPQSGGVTTVNGMNPRYDQIDLKRIEELEAFSQLQFVQVAQKAIETGNDTTVLLPRNQQLKITGLSLEQLSEFNFQFRSKQGVPKDEGTNLTLFVFVLSSGSVCYVAVSSGAVIGCVVGTLCLLRNLFKRLKNSRKYEVRQLSTPDEPSDSPETGVTVNVQDDDSSNALGNEGATFRQDAQGLNTPSSRGSDMPLLSGSDHGGSTPAVSQESDRSSSVMDEVEAEAVSIVSEGKQVSSESSVSNAVAPRIDTDCTSSALRDYLRVPKNSKPREAPDSQTSETPQQEEQLLQFNLFKQSVDIPGPSASFTAKQEVLRRKKRSRPHKVRQGTATPQAKCAN